MILKRNTAIVAASVLLVCSASCSGTGSNKVGVVDIPEVTATVEGVDANDAVTINVSAAAVISFTVFMIASCFLLYA